MTEQETQRRAVHILSADVARKIAAGEVVDRPAALVRELVDNAIDAGARTIEVQLEGGGARRTEVIDDGIGMTREDLALCWLPHATSKVESLEDLLAAETLGFRGEALAAITAVARVEILTSTDGREALQLSVGPGGFDRATETVERYIQQARRVRGTTVRVLGLFDAVPARKKFLKRDGAEALLCRQVFIDKAMAFPNRTFRLVQEGNLKLFLPPVASYRERFIQTQCTEEEKPFVYEVFAKGEGFSVSMVIGGPELYRRDRRQQFVFANGRRIQDFGLLQALEYGLQGAFPNGTHPLGALFITIDPALADFNIHPAKREVRFKDPGAIHGTISKNLRQFMHNLLVRTSSLAYSDQDLEKAESDNSFGSAAADDFATGLGGSTHIQPELGGSGFSGAAASGSQNSSSSLNFLAKPLESSRLAMEALLESPPAYRELPRQADAQPGELVRGADMVHAAASASKQGALFVGRLFGLFLIAESKGRLYIIDQHAAHERILYNRLSTHPVPQQELLIPIVFETDAESTDRFLTAHQKQLAQLGIVLETETAGQWSITALPAGWKKGDQETVQDILALEQAGETFSDRWLATMACHMAIKDGDYVDDITAQALIDAALELPVPRCPHGRPIWTVIDREELLKAVRRIE
ncbi:DNA mismatch repair endonuclease MutL [Gracilinema caldarium]|uniref:DNA mismatch repair endonuclease MutL n=1 Tax=Gracilinema caldarium TaxID=215591 RepID=UPI0026EF4ABB|nr:DNA mismatch repair endonuclease MutL [Gracilinema caldarium]